MEENHFKLRIASPLYLVASQEPCWRCGQTQEVVALAASNVDDGEGFFPPAQLSAPLLLSNIEEMPASVAETVLALHPHFQKHFSRTAGQTYFANLCECGTNFGDHYLHSEPGGAFFPETDEAAARMSIQRLPLEGEFELTATYSQGNEDCIFTHAQRLS